MENKTSKYFKYAIGEIVLVVIGILIALQVNNWNENRKLETYEKQLLDQLKSDFNRNSKDLKLNIKLQNKIIHSSELILKHLENKLPYHDSLKVHFGNTVLWTKFIVNGGAYKTVESKGLDIISNIELRDLTFRIYNGDLNWLQQMEKTVINTTENFLNNKASKYFTAINSLSIKNNKIAKGNVQLIDYSKLISEEGNVYKLYLNSNKNKTKFLLRISKGYLDDNKKAIAMIQSILNNNKELLND